MAVRQLAMRSPLRSWVGTLCSPGRKDGLPICALVSRPWLDGQLLGNQMVRGEKSGPEKDDADQHGDRRCDGAEHGVIVLPMPKLSHAMTSGRIAKWHVEEGASVNTYDVLLTVETETLVEEAYRLDQFAGKVALLVESQEEGFVARLLAAEGEEVPVGKPIALLCEREDEVPAARASIEWARLGDVYDSTCNPRVRLLEWQSYLARGPPSSGCL